MLWSYRRSCGSKK